MRKWICIAGLVAIILSMQGCHNSSNTDRACKTESNEVFGDISVYTEILMDYNTLIDYRVSRTFECDWNNGNYITESETLLNARCDKTGERTTHGVDLGSKWSYMIVEMVAGLENSTKEAFGYVIKDINDDSVPELFWLRNDRTILAIFTICDGDVVLLDAFYSRYKCVITNEGRIYTFAGGGGSNQYDLKSLSNEGRLDAICSFGTEWNFDRTGIEFFEIVDGQKIIVNEQHFQKLLTDNPFELSSEWRELPITFFAP